MVCEMCIFGHLPDHSAKNTYKRCYFSTVVHPCINIFAEAFYTSSISYDQTNANFYERLHPLQTLISASMLILEQTRGIMVLWWCHECKMGSVRGGVAHCTYVCCAKILIGPSRPETYAYHPSWPQKSSGASSVA